MLNELLFKKICNSVKKNTFDIKNILDSNRYSLNEVKTNKVWIDGKPIYRVVIDYSGQIPSNTTTQINLSDYIDVTKIEKITFLQTFLGTGLNIFPVPRAHNQSFNYQCAHHIGEGKLILETGNNFSSNHLTSIIEYTKTTD